MAVSRIDYCYNIRIEDDKTREVLFRLLQKCPTKAIYHTRDQLRYLDMLSAIGVNPITIPEDCGVSYIPSPFIFPSPVGYHPPKVQ